MASSPTTAVAPPAPAQTTSAPVKAPAPAPPSTQPPTVSTSTKMSSNALPNANATMPPTSLTDAGLTRRPRDARLIHMILASFGLSAYQERVPLQLLDFAYRYTSGVLQDAQHLSAEGYATSSSAAQAHAAKGGGSGAGAASADGGSVSLAALRLAVASRLNYQFGTGGGGLPKEFLLEMAAERNRVALPVVGREWGVRLPPERFCLTGVGWGLREDWESEGSEDDDDEEGGMEGLENKEEGEGEDGGDGEGDERMEDVFGDEDKDMADV